MTTKVKIEFPENNHAPYVDVFSVSPQGTETLIHTLTQGKSFETYVHLNQNILLRERF